MSIKYSSLGLESRSRMGRENKASHTVNMDESGRVWVNNGVSHRLSDKRLGCRYRLVTRENVL